MGAFNLSVFAVVLLLGFSSFASAQRKWQTLDGSAPLVIARGGFSGLFPDSSSTAYSLAMLTSVPDLILWCDVQLTKDGAGICFPDIHLDNSSNIKFVYEKRGNHYNVNGVPMEGYFPIDFTLKELSQVSLTQGIYSRSPDFDGLPLLTVESVFAQNKPARFWLNVQHDAFYSQHNLSMRSFIISASKRAIISHVSSPEVNFLREMARPFASTKTKLVFRFLDMNSKEPSTNQTYQSLLKNLTMIKTFASGILVPKTYIWPIDPTTLYLQPHTSLVADAHEIGLQVFAADFANDVAIAYDYSYNPVDEYLHFIDNGNFSVDGVLSDFPITPSEARDCFAHLGKKASAQAKPLVISHYGASGDFPDCTDRAYGKAIRDRADVIDCPVQMSKDGTPFCSSSVNLMNSTQVGQTQFRSFLLTAKDIQPSPGIFSFSLNWTDIQGLTPVISNPYPDYLLYRNPKSRNAGKILSLAHFLDLAKNANSLSRVLIKIENAEYLAVKQGLSIKDAVLNALDKAGYNDPTAKKVMILSSSSSVLKAMEGKNYELVYEVDETIRGAGNDVIADIKSFAHSVVIRKGSIFPSAGGFITTMTNVVSQLHASKLQVYVQTLRNEFISQAYDFFSDPVVEINSFVMHARVDGVFVDFPHAAAAYKRNRCLKMKDTPVYMRSDLIQPGQFMQLVNPVYLPPAEAPNPILTDANVSEPPLPAVVHDASAPSAAPKAPKTTPNGQHRISAPALLSCLAVIVATALLFS